MTIATELAPKITQPPVYNVPKEVLVGKPVVLTGSYGVSRITAVTLSAEDKVPLPVTLSGGTWTVWFIRLCSICLDSHWVVVKRRLVIICP